MRFVTTVYRRHELFALVWSEPMRDVARRYGVSDVALKKTCRKLRVPLPDAGHWNKHADRRDARPSLSPLPEGESGELAADRYVPEVDELEPLPADVQKHLDREKESGAEIAVPTTLTSPHPLVASARGLLARASADADGFIVIDRDRSCLDLRVSPAQLDRALRLMDALLKALASRGAKTEVTPRNGDRHARDPALQPNATRVAVDGVWVTLRLVEKCRMERPPGPTPPAGLAGQKLETWSWLNQPRIRYVPKGAFELTACCGNQQATWRDSASRSVEGRLNDVVARLHVLVHRHRHAAAAAAREEERRREEARRQYEQEQRAAEERERASRLREEVERWELARSIRAYVADAQAIVTEGPCKLDEGSGLARSLRWALAYADKIDPYTALRAEVAQHVAAAEAGALASQEP